MEFYKQLPARAAPKNAGDERDTEGEQMRQSRPAAAPFSKYLLCWHWTNGDHSSLFFKKTAANLNCDSVSIEVTSEESSIDRFSGHLRRRRIEASGRQ